MSKKKEDMLAKNLDAYIRQKKTQEECSGFIDGFEKCFESNREMLIDFANKFNEELGFPGNSEGISEFVDEYLNKM
jgi:hypothetical protein